MDTERQVKRLHKAFDYLEMVRINTASNKNPKLHAFIYEAKQNIREALKICVR